MSSCDCYSLIAMFKGNKTADQLIQSTEIIKNMIIGISYLDNNNPNGKFRKIFGNIISHASIFFFLGKKNRETGIIVQYGKYAYIKEKKDILKKEAETIGYPYGERGGLIFGEMKYNDFIDEFCTICSIKPILGKKQITLKKFIEEVKKNGVWDLNSYNYFSHNCQDFAAVGISIINPKYHPSLIHIKDNRMFGEDEEGGVPTVIIKQLNKNRIKF